MTGLKLQRSYLLIVVHLGEAKEVCFRGQAEIVGLTVFRPLNHLEGPTNGSARANPPTINPQFCVIPKKLKARNSRKSTEIIRMARITEGFQFMKASALENNYDVSNTAK